MGQLTSCSMPLEMKRTAAVTIAVGLFGLAGGTANADDSGPGRTPVRRSLRQPPRVTLGAGVALGVLEVYERRHGGRDIVTMQGGVVAVGLHHDFSERLGGYGRLGAIIGAACVPDDEEARPKLLSGTCGYLSDFGLDFGLLFNVWRVFFGPVATVGLRLTGSRPLMAYDGPYDLGRAGLFHGGLGSKVGFLLLERRQLEVSLLVHLDVATRLPHATLGFAYHFQTFGAQGVR